MTRSSYTKNGIIVFCEKDLIQFFSNLLILTHISELYTVLGKISHFAGGKNITVHLDINSEGKIYIFRLFII